MAISLYYECGNHFKAKPVETNCSACLNKIMLQNAIFSDIVSVILDSDVLFSSLSSYRKREHFVEAVSSKSGLLNVTLTPHLSSKCALHIHVRTDRWL